MANKYIWLIDTIRRYGRITRAGIERQWVLSTKVSAGKPLSRRSFINYKNGAEEMFGVSINCDLTTNEYYLDDISQGDSEARMRDWLLDSISLSNVLRDSQNLAERIVLENVPSARDNLPVVLEALKAKHRVQFNYSSHRSYTGPHAVTLEPHFVRIFKQLWYVVGYNVKDRKVKTYSLDRMTDLSLTDHSFKYSDNVDAQRFFYDCFGITTTDDPPQSIRLKVNSLQAKYLRALPLHHSQREETVFDSYSIFSYRLCVTYDLIEQLLSYGPEVEVLQPQSLRSTIKARLEAALSQYGDGGKK